MRASNISVYGLVLGVFILVFTKFALGQGMYQKTFHSAQGLVCKSMIPTANQGYLMTGELRYLTPQLYDMDAALVQTDSLGNILWSKSYGGTNLDGFLKSIETSDYSFIHIGYSRSYGPSGIDQFSNPLEDNIYIVKTDENGNVIWTRIYGDTLIDGCQDVLFRNDDDIIVLNFVNWTYLSTQNASDMHLMCIDSTGIPKWSRLYYSPAGFKLVPTSISNSSNDDLFITGTVSFSDSINWSDVFLSRLNATGDIIWSIVINIGANIHPSYVIGHPDNGVIIGLTVPGSGTISSATDFVLAHIDSLGNIVWAKKYGSPSGGSDKITALSYNNDSTNLIFSSYGIVYKTDLSGNILWSIMTTTLFTNIVLDVFQKNDFGYQLSGYRQISQGNAMSMTQIDSTGVGCNSVFTTKWMLPITIQPMPLLIADSIVTLSMDTGCNEVTISVYDTLYCQSATAINEDIGGNTTSISVYPNPFINKVSLNNISGITSPIEVIVIDTYGKVKETFNYLPDSIYFPESANGVYLIIIKTGSGVERLKIIQMS